MSAFVVSEYHIAVLAEYAVNRGCVPHGLPDTAEGLGKAMWEENVKSVVYRYPSESAETYGEYRHPRGVVFQFSRYSPVEIIKAAQCLEYQSCEHPTWEKSPVYRLLKWIMSEAIRSLPGYEQAPWGLEAPTTRKTA